MTREEAIRRIKSWNLDSDDMEVLSVVIPELRESEDERIRKYIVKFVELEKGVNLPPDDADEILAWLEKQKEQTEDLSTRLNGLMQEYVKSGKDEEEQEHRLKCYQLFWDALGDSEFFKQKEQKPVEWSDTDNIGWDEAFACVTRVEKAAKNEEELQNAVTAEKWLKEIKFKYCVHSVKQEWSEQDIQYYDAVMDMITNARYLPCRPRDEIVEWFKSLKNRGNFPKSNTNSPSWSEEDEKRVKQLIYDTEFIKAHYEKRKEELGEQFNNALIRDCDEQIAWLKSLRLRPSWKPSDKQMEALKRVFYNRPIGSAELSEIESLYNDLKKL